MSFLVSATASDVTRKAAEDHGALLEWTRALIVAAEQAAEVSTTTSEEVCQNPSAAK